MASEQTVYLQGLIDRLRQGDDSARNELVGCAYERLRLLARKMLHEDFPRLQDAHATGSVLHEAALRLLTALPQVTPPTVRDFFCLAVVQMRRVLIDMARRQRHRQRAAQPAVLRAGVRGRRQAEVKRWDLDTAQALPGLQGHRGEITCLAFSPDGKQLATGSRDRAVKVWDLGSGQAVLTLEGHGKEVHGVAFSADGERLAGALGDGSVKVWDLTAGREILTLSGHTGYVSSVAFSPDGRHLASAGSDETVRLWDLRGGRSVRILRGHTQIILWVAFSPDGKRLVSTGGDEVKVWDLALLKSVNP